MTEEPGLIYYAFLWQTEVFEKSDLQMQTFTDFRSKTTIGKGENPDFFQLRIS